METDRLLGALREVHAARTPRERCVALSRLGVLVEVASLEAVAALDVSADYELDGATSVGNWLAGHTESSGTLARSLGRSARALFTMPHVAAATESGLFGTEKVALFTWAANHKRVGHLFPEWEERLVTWAVEGNLSVDDTAVMLRHWIAGLDQDGPAPADIETQRVALSETKDGSWALHGTLSPEDGARLFNTLDRIGTDIHHAHKATREALGVDAPPMPSRDQIRAQALVEMAARTEAVDEDRSEGPVVGVEIVADLDTITELLRHQDSGDADPTLLRSALLGDTNTTVAGRTLRRLLCGAQMQLIGIDEHGAPLWAGQEIRFANRAQRRALRVRDGGCAFPGCGRPFAWTQAHHIHTWEDGGPTDIDNLVALCTHHHNLVHHSGFEVELVDGIPEFRRPDHTVIHANQRFNMFRCGSNAHARRCPTQVITT